MTRKHCFVEMRVDAFRDQLPLPDVFVYGLGVCRKVMDSMKMVWARTAVFYPNMFHTLNLHAFECCLAFSEKIPFSPET